MRHLILFLIALSLRAQTADEIIKRTLDVMGGAERFSAIRTLRIKGIVDGTPITVLAQRPTLFRVEVGDFAQAWDGHKAWMRANGKITELTGAQLNQVKDQAFSAIGGPLVDAHERGNQVTFEGHETLDGHDALKLKITLPTGTVINWYLDPSTYLEFHEQLIAGKQIIEEDVSDFRKYGGVLFPCRFASHGKGETAVHELLVKEVEVNPGLPEGVFNMPSSPPEPGKPETKTPE